MSDQFPVITKLTESADTCPKKTLLECSGRKHRSLPIFFFSN